jgi:hypothetical protein
MRILALALSLFASALIADVDLGPLFDAAEAKSRKVERAETQRSARQPPKRQRQANKRSPTLPPNIGTGIGTGL